MPAKTALQEREFIDDTLKIIGRDLSAQSGFTLSAIMHNEIYFLPDFLNHYRNLGVERFILLDDRSTDGSLEYALEQKDVMVLQSDYRYGDWRHDPMSGKKRRAMLSWRQSLLSRFGASTWSLHVDLDEFVDLPKGMNFPSFCQELSAQPAIIWGAMIDLYPESWNDIIQENPPAISEVNWYFDALPHIRLGARKTSTPLTLYSGARARLRSKYMADNVNEKWRRKLERIFSKNPYPKMGSNYKPVLINWGNHFRFRSSHRIAKAGALRAILPIRHYKFAPDFVSRFEYALKSEAHNNNSRGYKELKSLYENMTKADAGFLGKESSRHESFQDFLDCGIAYGINASGKLKY